MAGFVLISACAEQAEDLPMENESSDVSCSPPVDSCVCGSEVVCKGRRVECADEPVDQIGLRSRTLPATDDGIDAWSEVTGTFEVLPGPDALSATDTDFFWVPVTDTLLGDLAPEIEFSHDGQLTARVCIGGISTGWLCDQDEGGHCCMEVGPGETATNSAFGGLPGLSDSSEYSFVVEAKDVPTGSCVSYRMRYRF